MLVGSECQVDSVLVCWNRDREAASAGHTQNSLHTCTLFFHHQAASAHCTHSQHNRCGLCMHTIVRSAKLISRLVYSAVSQAGMCMGSILQSLVWRPSQQCSPLLWNTKACNAAQLSCNALSAGCPGEYGVHVTVISQFSATATLFSFPPGIATLPAQFHLPASTSIHFVIHNHSSCFPRSV